MKKILGLVFAVSLILLPLAASADPISQTLPDEDVSTVIDKVGNIIFGIILVMAVIYILLAAIGFVTSNGDQEKLKTAQNRLIYALIGIVVAVLAKGIVNLVRSTLDTSGTSTIIETTLDKLS